MYVDQVFVLDNIGGYNVAHVHVFHKVEIQYFVLTSIAISCYL